MNGPIALVDLDDTLFQTARKCPRDIPAERLNAIARDKDGNAAGFMTPRQSAMYSWLQQGLVIPVTARTRRVAQRSGIEHAAGIYAHGGVLYGLDGTRDDDWHDQVSTCSADARIEEIYGDLARPAADEAPGTFRHWIMIDEALPLAIVIKDNEDDEERLHVLARRIHSLMPAGWRLHLNGNNAAFMPAWLGKEHAVAHFLPQLRESHPDAPIIGMGDSSTDLPFLALCDYAMVPAGCQAQRMLTEVLGWKK